MNILGALKASYNNLLHARRALVFVFVWSLAMIATLQFHHALNDNSVSTRGGDSQGSSYRLGPSSLREKENNEAAMEPLVDKREPRTEEELVRDIESRLPSLPFAYWLKMRAKLEKAVGNAAKNQKNVKQSKQERGNEIKNGTGTASSTNPKKSCVPRYPSIYDLEFNNVYWQSLRTSNGTFQLYGAYYDARKLLKIGAAIRIIGMLDRIEPRVKTYCQLWYDGDSEPAIVQTFEYKYVWNSKWGNYKQGIYQPYVIACKVPQSHQARGPPVSVSLVERACDTSSNNLRVIYNKPDVKRGFAVCVKGLDFLHDDLSVRLIEWIELVSLLGADKIHFYQLQVHPNVSKVLDYYTGLGKIDVTPITLPGGQPNIPAFQHMYLVKKVNNKRLNELIPYNDCLYKHMYEYEYIALLDIDEVIMPLKDSTWPELMKRVLPKALALYNQTRASYNVRNVYFLDDFLRLNGAFEHIPKYMHMLQHVFRSRNFTKPHHYVKCFHNTERVLTLHNHYPLACLGADCTTYSIETEDAQLQHYRADCVRALKKSCSEYKKDIVTDTTIWRHADRLIERVNDTLEKLGFFTTKNSLT